MQSTQIQLKLFAALTPMAPEKANQLPIKPGISIKELLDELKIPSIKAHLIFVNGVKQSLDTRLQGGERVGIFPPVAGG